MLNLYRALSARFTITLLTSTDFGARREEIFHSPHFREIRFPKDELWRNAFSKLEEAGLGGDLSGLAFALAVSDPQCALRQTARALAASADHIVHEFPYSEPLFADGLFARKEVYNSHNFEASLLGSIVHGSGFDAAFLKLFRLEGTLVARAERVFATSQADADKFRLFYGVPAGKLDLCPNGLDESQLAVAAEGRRRIRRQPPRRPLLLFFGSAHAPNVEAAEALIALAHRLGECEIVIAGGVSGAIRSAAMPSNIVLVGPFDEAAKTMLLAGADLFLNPVVLGSGTSLKALEALGAGVPLVSTPEGVRGLDLIANQHAAIVERGAFPDAIRSLISDPRRAAAMAEAAGAFARARYAWQRIADRFGDAIGSSAAEKTGVDRSLVLAFNDYPVLDASWGGKARIRNLLSGLDSDVVLVSFGAVCDILLLAPNFLQIVVPKTREHGAFEQASNEGQPLTVNDCVASLFAGANRIMGEIAAAVARRAQVLVFEHCYLAPILDVVDTVSPDIPVIYSAHNVEADHRVRMLLDHSAGEALGDLVRQLEERLARRAELIVCCTEADALRFARDGAETLVVANGCAVPNRETLKSAAAPSDRKQVRVGFMGSSHGPNVEAATFIARKLAPALPSVTFEFLGGVGEALGGALPSNVTVRGVLDDAAKTATLAGWTVALNPVASGGGSSLKLPDFMAHGLPTINTASGARGFDIERKGAGVVVERERFPETLRKLLSDPEARGRQGANAYEYASRELDWKVLVGPYKAKLHGIMGQGGPQALASPRSLLVVTYRYTEPSLGGAEEYLIEVLKQWRPRFARIDLAAVDAGRLSNEHHFGCKVSDTGGGASSRIAELFDQALFFSPDHLPEAEVVERCRKLERAWTAAEFDLYLPFAEILAKTNRLRLFGGFYGPEVVDGAVRRWSSPGFSILLPSRSTTLRLMGFVDRPKPLAVTLIRLTADLVPEIVAEHSLDLETQFAVNLSLPRMTGREVFVVHCDVDEFQPEGDHRPLGVFLESASALVAREVSHAVDAIAVLDESVADLAEDKDLELRTEHFEGWLSALIASGRRNSAAMEANFAAVRGPHSAAMQEWIASHAGDYDTVLVQGIPFDVIPRTVETLRQAPQKPRIVTLPHFHGDDRFYHWRRYMQAFEVADTSLFFSRAITEQLGLHGRTTVVPGGGVRPEEPGDLTAAGRFRELHPGATPFFLVLGRKIGSKGYDRVLAAHAALRSRGYGLDLVLIGPDEDGRAIGGDGVFYLGRQPREVVRGALSQCRALVSMSSSESFGIVLCEAWLFGKPVIANRCCYSFRDLVQDGRNGLLVGDDVELARAMALLAGDEASGRAMGQVGRAEVLRAYTWPALASRIFNALDASA